MRLVSTVLIVLLAGCAGHETGPWDPGDQGAFTDETAPGATNDGFYDGGVFDQDGFDRRAADLM